MMFFIWMLLPLVIILLAGIYLCRKVYMAVCFFGKKLTKRMRIMITAGVTGILILSVGYINGLWFVIFMYMVVFLLMFDFFALIVKKFRKNKTFPYWGKAVYRSGILALLAAVLLVGYGYYNMHHIVKTEYTVLTDKEIREEGYTIVFFSDLHYGTTMDGEQLKRAADAIESENPDMVILGGDIVDERTSLAQMQEAFEIMGNIRTEYGIYYVYGNHDRSEYAERPNYTAAQLEDAIERAGIHILEDEAYAVNSEILLIGRADRGHGSDTRKSIFQLVEGADAAKEWILIDHQPVEYADVMESGCGLMLSGHTHAGQVWPLGFLAEVFHTNELTYGYREEGNLTEVVSSGIAGWGYPVRTQKHSEYVVIHLIKPLRAASSNSFGWISG
ncbi:MAG: metallophosphoesterase [Lachnospiraceae bacterium]|nr:metallophosphoesterase [Lachnospiraceae bacterium]